MSGVATFPLLLITIVVDISPLPFSTRHRLIE